MSNGAEYRVICVAHPDNHRSVIYVIRPFFVAQQLVDIIDDLPLYNREKSSFLSITSDPENDRVLLEVRYPSDITVGTTPDGVHRTVFNGVGKMTKSLPTWEYRIGTDIKEF